MKHQNIKKRCIILSVLFLAVIIGCAALMVHLSQNTHSQIMITKESVEIRENGDHPANNRQYQASVWLGAFEGKLYFYPHCGYASRRTMYDGFMCVFENGGVTILKDLEAGKTSVIMQGFLSPFLYYWDNNASLSKQSDFLYCYDLQSGEDRQLCSGEAMLMHNSHESDKGLFYFPLWVENGETPKFVCVKDGAFSKVAPLTKGYHLNGRTYYAVAEYGDTAERILCQDENGFVNEIPMGYAHHRSVIPCENGLIIHNESGSDILYWINEAGDVQKLFSVECLDSRSAVNVHGTDVYLSLKRYKEYGEIGMKRYENDTLEGTYRISLTDYSVQRLSDQIYDGLYNFDDTCLYACDENCNIFQIDFNGNLIQTLFCNQSDSQLGDG